MTVKLLLHSCCGPCTIMPLAIFRAENANVTGYFYNPNIHPYLEFQRRLDTYRQYMQAQQAPVILDAQYDLDEFLRRVAERVDTRCPLCYEIRLERAAKIAKEHGFDAFSTTLSVSPYQNHELLIAAGEKAAEKYAIPFVYRDFRPFFRTGQAKAKELALYRQGYCGCIYSERDRYEKKR